MALCYKLLFPMVVLLSAMFYPRIFQTISTSWQCGHLITPPAED